MIDPVHSLAFSMQANPEVYAILLGPGVLRAAKIPTGWDLTLDLIRVVALSKEAANRVRASEHFRWNEWITSGEVACVGARDSQGP